MGIRVLVSRERERERRSSVSDEMTYKILITIINNSEIVRCLYRLVAMYNIWSYNIILAMYSIIRVTLAALSQLSKSPR